MMAKKAISYQEGTMLKIWILIKKDKMYGCNASHKPDLPREEIIQTYYKAKKKTVEEE